VSINRDNLFRICEQHTCGIPGVVVPEPYIPHFPEPMDQWNGTLVVAEAQNLGATEAPYRMLLQKDSAAGRRERLWNRLNQGEFYRKGSGIGIGPWDDGTMKLTVAVLRGADAVHQVAVSNAVVWSASAGGATENLDKRMLKASADFWRDLLDFLRPNDILAFGSTARTVMRRTGFPPERIIELPGPFRRRLQMGFKMDTGRLLVAFPEVAAALTALRSSVCVANEALAVHCACASLSLSTRGGKLGRTK